MKTLSLENTQLVAGGSIWIDFDITLPLSTLPVVVSTFGSEEDSSIATTFVQKLSDTGADINALTYTVAISYSQYP